MFSEGSESEHVFIKIALAKINRREIFIITFAKRYPRVILLAVNKFEKNNPHPFSI